MMTRSKYFQGGALKVRKLLVGSPRRERSTHLIDAEFRLQLPTFKKGAMENKPWPFKHFLCGSLAREWRHYYFAKWRYPWWCHILGFEKVLAWDTSCSFREQSFSLTDSQQSINFITRASGPWWEWIMNFKFFDLSQVGQSNLSFVFLFCVYAGIE